MKNHEEHCPEQNSSEMLGQFHHPSSSATANPPPDNADAVEIFGELCYAEKSDFYRASEKDVTKESCGFENAGERVRTCSRGVRGEFPPPITTIGSGGKPRVYFKSIRKDGRFVLREIRIPTQRLLQAKREDGRLTMRVLRERDGEEEVKEAEEEQG